MTDDNIQLLVLLADLRIALGDNGKRMQPELVEYARELKRKADEADAEVTHAGGCKTFFVPTS